MLDKAKTYIQTNIYSPQRIMELLDLNGGQLSYQGIAILRQLEANGEQYLQNTILPSTTAIQNAGKL
jgi:hypothetical protein